VKGYPLPRTAERYSVSSDCDLLSLNLTIDGNTGQLRFIKGCSSVGCGMKLHSDFQASCTITAHEGSLEASASLTITGSHFMVWPSSVLIVPTGGQHLFPSRSVCTSYGPATAQLLEDAKLANGTTTPAATTTTTPAATTTAGKDTTTVAPTSTTSSPGGSSCSLNLSCLPLSAPDWLQMQQDGSLSVSNTGAKTPGIPGLTALLELVGLEASSGSLCNIRNGTEATASVLTLVPETWTSIRYPYDAVSVDLNTTLHPALDPKDVSSVARVAPMRFSASCVTDENIEIVFDELNGMATAEGYRIFHLDVSSGILQLSPEANLSHLFDSIQTNRVRAGIRLDCTVLGHFEWQVGVPVEPIKGQIEILVEDSTCWIPPSDSPDGWQEVRNLPNLPPEACRRACRADVLCGVYSVDAGCKFLAPCGPHPLKKKQCTSYTKVVEKVTNCGLGRTCLNLTGLVSRVWRYQGVFCPAALGVEATTVTKGVPPKLSWIYEKVNVATAQDVFYLQAASTDPRAKCGQDGLLLTKSNKSWDFKNLTANYIELYGEHVACLELQDGGSPVDQAFKNGKAALTASQSTTDVGSGLELTLGQQFCSAPKLLTQEEVGKGEEGLVADEVVIDDPSTTTSSDFTLHPCDCFPTSWGPNSPVTAQSFADVPAGSNNVYYPEMVEIVKGSYTCAQNSFVTATLTENFQSCQHACDLAANCSFFWYGSMASLPQCLLYNATCSSLVLVEGSSGTLAAMQSWWPSCHRADPEKCWAYSKRRTFLGADTGAKIDRATGGDCVHQQFIEQCDLMLLLGGAGVEQCFGCKYANLHLFGDSWKRKRRLPSTFRTGTRLTFSCWIERYAAVTPTDVIGEVGDSHTVTCTGKHWHGPDGREGIGGFACGACVEIMAPDFANYQEQNVQELYFLPNLQFSIGIDQAWPLKLTKAGTLLYPVLYPWDSTEGTSKIRLNASQWEAEIHRDGSAMLVSEAGCLHWNPDPRRPPSCATWCAADHLGDCRADMTGTFLCSRFAAGHCLFKANNTWQLQDMKQGCPSSVRRRDGLSAHGALEDGVLLQLRRGVPGAIGCHEIIALVENSRSHVTPSLNDDPFNTLGTFSARAISSGEPDFLNFFVRQNGFMTECLQYTGAGSLNVGSCATNGTFTIESLFQSMHVQRLAQGMEIFLQPEGQQLGLMDRNDTGPRTSGQLGEVIPKRNLPLTEKQFVRSCYLSAMNNISLSDPDDDRSQLSSLLNGCGTSPVAQVPYYFFSSDMALYGTTFVQSVFYVMYGTNKCIGWKRQSVLGMHFKLLDPCFEDGKDYRLEAAFTSRQGSNDIDQYDNGNIGIASAIKTPDAYFEYKGVKCLFSDQFGYSANLNEYPCDQWYKGIRWGGQVIWHAERKMLKAKSRCWFVIRTDAYDKLTFEECDNPKMEAEEKYAQWIQEGSWFKVQCPAGSLLNKVYKWEGQLRMDYACQRMTYIGSCLEWVTNSVAATEKGLMEARVSCPTPDMGIQEMTLSTSAFSSDSGSYTIRYKCCYTGSMATQVEIIRGEPLIASHFSKIEGVYCPHDRDETGRLVYEQRKSYEPVMQPKGVLAFDSTLGQWCLKWKNTFGKILDKGCVDSYVAEPLEDEGLRYSNWAALPIMDFNGVFAGKGHGSATISSADKLKWNGERPKPTLLTFAAEKPQQAVECKRLVPDWEEVGKMLSKENPCSFVSGATRTFENWFEDNGYASWLATTPGNVGKFDSGFSYEKLMGCFDRSVERSLQGKEQELNREIGVGTTDFMLTTASKFCTLIPNTEIAPFGFGVEIKSGKVCESALDVIKSAADLGLNVDYAKVAKELAYFDSKDCAGDAASFARVWCDIHCVKDAVEQGNRALSKSLENAVKVLTTNVGRLTKYQAQMVGDKVDELRAEVQDFFEDSKRVDPHEDINTFLRETMANIHSLLAEHPLDSAGKDAASRAIESFVSAVSGFSDPLVNSSTESAMALIEGANDMYHTLKFTTKRHGLDRLEALTKNLGLATEAMQSLARARNNQLGVYHHSSVGSKKRQEALLDFATHRAGSDEAEDLFDFGRESNTWQVLLELDSTWWSIRALLDEYLDHAERYAKSISNVAQLLQSYTSCSMEYAPVHEGFSQLMKTEKSHRITLAETWTKAMPLVGLLISKVVDGDAFAKLSIEDAKSAYEMLKPRVKELCHNDLNATQTAVALAVNTSLKEGFFGQTQHQLAVLFQELQMLRGRGENLSKDSLNQLQQTLRRAQLALQAATPLHQQLTHRSVKTLCKTQFVLSGRSQNTAQAKLNEES